MKKLDSKTIENAFDDIKLVCDNAQFDEEFSIYEEYLEMFDTVELALDELIERREMMKRFNEASVPSVIDDDTYKKAEALEIIKENKIEGLTLEWDGTWWTICVPNYPFPIAYGRKKEEYDLLKEVLS